MLVLRDLANLGWQFRVVRDTVYMIPRSVEQMRTSDAKQVIRESLLKTRGEQLAQASTRAFLEKMHRLRTLKGETVSIDTLIDDGATLAASITRNMDRDLRESIRPYLQHVDASKECQQTGLNLMDIWRYFRHTWSLEYRAVPGRTVNFLIRNAARPGHPVMGIIGLANPVFQLSCRDHTIGWTPEAIIRRVIGDPSYWPTWRKEALRCLSEAQSRIRSDDLFKAIGRPRSLLETVAKLRDLAHVAENQRKDALQKHFEETDEIGPVSKVHKKTAKGRIDWRAASNKPLFKRKRAATLADILFAIDYLSKFGDDPSDLLSEVELLFSTEDGKPVSASGDPQEFLSHVESDTGFRPVLRWQNEDLERAFKIASREIRKNGISTRVLDVNVCGASPVYRELLGGKLAVEMLFSEQLQQTYLSQYCEAESEIASSMAGRAMTRPTRISVLTTTSLYGVGSSQYNRVRLGSLHWVRVGSTEGFGTVHFSKQTIDALRELAVRRRGLRSVNNQFGEGTSPLLRQMREGLALLGLEPNDVLQHSNKRIVYALELYPGAFADLCLDRDSHKVGPSTEAIAEHWMQRWLSMRIRNPEVLDRLALISPQTVRSDLGIATHRDLSSITEAS